MTWTNFLWAMVGALVEAITFGIIMYVRSAHGVLKVDHSNPEKDVYRFEIDDLDSLSKKKYVQLTIDHNADLSQN